MRLKSTLATTAAVFAATLALGSTPAHAAVAVDYTPIPLTQSEVDAHWFVDRAVPSGGYGSLSGFEGRSDVLEVRIDKDNRSSSSSFYYTEGLQRAVDGVDAAKVELYVDPDWTTNHKSVRAGFWGVGHDATGAVSSYPIVEFTTAGDAGFTGWRVWDSPAGVWVNHPEVPVTPGQWATLEVVHRADTGSFDLRVNGATVGSSADEGSVDLGAVILNSYNYGPAAASYDVHWSGFATGAAVQVPGSKDDCRHGGFAAYGFANQGQCIASLQANEASGH